MDPKATSRGPSFTTPPIHTSRRSSARTSCEVSRTQSSVASAGSCDGVGSGAAGDDGPADPWAPDGPGVGEARTTPLPTTEPIQAPIVSVAECWARSRTWPSTTAAWRVQSVRASVGLGVEKDARGSAQTVSVPDPPPMASKGIPRSPPSSGRMAPTSGRPTEDVVSGAHVMPSVDVQVEPPEPSPKPDTRNPSFVRIRRSSRVLANTV